MNIFPLSLATNSTVPRIQYPLTCFTFTAKKFEFSQLLIDKFISYYSRQQMAKVYTNLLHPGVKLCESLLVNEGLPAFLRKGKANEANIQIVDSKYQGQECCSPQKCPIIIEIKDLDKRPAAILALSGNLSIFGQNSQKEFVPSHLVEMVLGISLAILVLQCLNDQSEIRTRKTFSISIIEMVKYMGAFNISAKENGLIADKLGNNFLDGGAPFYQLYPCKEGIVAVGNLEPKFYSEMIQGLTVSEQTKTYLLESHINKDQWPNVRNILQKEFLKKTAKQWEDIMSQFDTCVTQVKSSDSSWPKQPRMRSLVTPKL